MKAPLLLVASLGSLLSLPSFAAEPEFPLTADSQPHDGIPKGELIKATYTAEESSLFPGTEREYAIYLPAGLDPSKPAPFMVFQDGVIYQAPVVFDNLIAKKEIPPLIGIFIKPGVVPAANDNALPRFNRSYEYDSVTDNYARFLIDEFLPAIKAKHSLNLSDDPNARGIAGNSSGGICAFMVAWHRPDQFRRVFTGVGTYVGIHGADQLPVLVRKYEPKPLRVFLQSGENDNNLYCGDWWMANQMMERSLTWNGYDVNHAWGTGGHNGKHATQIFPDVLRWLWKGYPDEPVKANPRGDAKWRGYEVIGDGDWVKVIDGIHLFQGLTKDGYETALASDAQGRVLFINQTEVRIINSNGDIAPASRSKPDSLLDDIKCVAFGPKGAMFAAASFGEADQFVAWISDSGETLSIESLDALHVILAANGQPYATNDLGMVMSKRGGEWPIAISGANFKAQRLTLSPDQTHLFATSRDQTHIMTYQLQQDQLPQTAQPFGLLEVPMDRQPIDACGLCVDTNGWLYVATSLGIQVLDQAGRVNFIIPTPKQPHDVCFGGKDLSELFIACGDTIYKRPTKARGYISGQMAPIKPPPPKL